MPRLPRSPRSWTVQRRWPGRTGRSPQAYLLEAIARDSLGDSGAAHRALERALDLAEPDGVLLPFLLHPAPGLLDRHARHPTAHASLLGSPPTTAPRPSNTPADFVPDDGPNDH